MSPVLLFSLCEVSGTSPPETGFELKCDLRGLGADSERFTPKPSIYTKIALELPLRRS